MDNSVQTMRWILVNMTAVAALVALALGYWTAAVILLLGVAAHTTHWLMHRRRPAAVPVEDV
ncbi:hypothetical protein [Euzebya sp.]|uniref:hypothetical protein n=1 Tax=Euzebya sp. TaxID=1971409 RepID=UPI003514B953